MNLKNQLTCCAADTTKQADSSSTALPAAVTPTTDGQSGWWQAIVQANWRGVCILTMAFSLIAFGIFVVIQGFHFLRQMWVLGPIFIMCGCAVMVSAFFIRKKPTDSEMFSEKYSSNSRQADDEYDDPDRQEQQAVPMEPLVFLLH